MQAHKRLCFVAWSIWESNRQLHMTRALQICDQVMGGNEGGGQRIKLKVWISHADIQLVIPLFISYHPFPSFSSSLIYPAYILWAITLITDYKYTPISCPFLPVPYSPSKSQTLVNPTPLPTSWLLDI